MKTIAASLVLFAALMAPQRAAAVTFTVDCNDTVSAAPGDGLWVVGTVSLTYIFGHPFLTGVSCTSVPGDSTPVVPTDGVVCFCPSKASGETNCNAHADVEQSTTTGFCLQSPIDNPSATTEASTAVFRRGHLRRLRILRRVLGG